MYRVREQKKRKESLVMDNDTREIRTRASEETRTLPWRLRPTRPEYPIPISWFKLIAHIVNSLSLVFISFAFEIFDGLLSVPAFI